MSTLRWRDHRYRDQIESTILLPIALAVPQALARFVVPTWVGIAVLCLSMALVGPCWIESMTFWKAGRNRIYRSHRTILSAVVCWVALLSVAWGIHSLYAALGWENIAYSYYVLASMVGMGVYFFYLVVLR